MADLKKFETELRTEHEQLTKAYERAHVEAETAWVAYEQAKENLVAFRNKYHRVIKALDQGAVKVEG